MYRIAVIDDNSTDSEYVTTLVKRWAEGNFAVQIVTFPSAEAFLFTYEEDKNWDILLLDIEMGAMNGVELAKKIRQENQAVQIIFITGFPDFVGEGYEVAALHYLMKPVSAEKLSAVLDRAVVHLGKREKYLTVSHDRQQEFVPVSEILYVEAERQYVLIHTAGEVYRMKASLSETRDKLDEFFFQCQRSFLVNLRYVKRINSGNVVLKNGEEVPISRGMAEKIGKEIVRLF